MQGLTVNSKYNEQDPYHIYYDLEAINLDPSGLPTYATEYDDTRVQAFIRRPANYFLSVVRFSLDTPTLPVFYPFVVLGQSDYNKLIYTITFNIHGTLYTQNIEYVPANSTVNTPAPPLLVQDISTDYYAVYTMQAWVDMVNNTFDALATSAGLSEVPFLEYNIDDSLFQLYVPTSYDGNVLIYVNSPLKVLLNTFNFSCLYNTTLGYQWDWIFQNNINNTVTYDTVNYYVMYQERTTLALYNPVRSIVFTTSIIPVLASLTATPVFLSVNGSNSTSTATANITPIISDFEVLTQNGSSYINNILYEPTAEYRLFSMIGDTELNQIKIAVYWKDKLGKLHPFQMAFGCAFSMKVMFRRTDLHSIPK